MKRALGIGVAVMLAGGAHLLGAGYFTPDAIELDGGGEPAPARLGSSFADMVAGMPGSDRPDVMDPVDVEETPQDPIEAPQAETPEAEVQEPAESDPREPTDAERTDVAELEPTDMAEVADTSRQPEVADADTSEATMADIPSTLDTPPLSAPIAIAAAPSIIAAVPVAPTSIQPSATITPMLAQPTLTPSTPVAPTATATPPDTMVAEDEAVLTPLTSPRPRTRPEGLAPPPPEPAPQVAAPRPQPQALAATGNAATNATRGSETGAETAAATANAPAAQPAPQPGNAAAVANYPGQVLRRISRQGRPRVRHTGADVVISFRINGGGGLAGLSVARSSGNAELDQAGLSIVQRAAPFPAPPAGAQTSFSINFGGR